MTIDLRKEHVSLRQEADFVMYAQKPKSETQSEAQSALIESLETTLEEVWKSIQLSILENRVDFCRLYQHEALYLLETAEKNTEQLRWVLGLAGALFEEHRHHFVFNHGDEVARIRD
jgi:hypothetical protein